MCGTPALVERGVIDRAGAVQGRWIENAVVVVRSLPDLPEFVAAIQPANALASGLNRGEQHPSTHAHNGDHNEREPRQLVWGAIEMRWDFTPMMNRIDSEQVAMFLSHTH